MKNYVLKSKFFLSFIVLVSISTQQLHAFDAVPFEENARWRTCFTPTPKGKKKCTDMLVDIIDGSTSNIYMQAYSFTSQPIADALERAAERGVEVSVIFDHGQGQSQYSQRLPLAGTKVNVYVDKPSRLAHNKVVIVDEKITVTGSFNYSKSAQYGNTENLLAIEDPSLAQNYYKNWLRRLEKVKRQKATRTGGYVTETPHSKKEASRKIADIQSPSFVSGAKRSASSISEVQSDTEPKRHDQRPRMPLTPVAVNKFSSPDSPAVPRFPIEELEKESQKSKALQAAEAAVAAAEEASGI